MDLEPEAPVDPDKGNGYITLYQAVCKRPEGGGLPVFKRAVLRQGGLDGASEV